MKCPWMFVGYVISNRRFPLGSRRTVCCHYEEVCGCDPRQGELFEEEPGAKRMPAHLSPPPPRASRTPSKTRSDATASVPVLASAPSSTRPGAERDVYGVECVYADIEVVKAAS